MEKYIISINDVFEFKKDDVMWIELYIRLAIDTKNISFQGELLGWSNDKQKYIEFDKSEYTQLPKEQYDKIDSFYKTKLAQYLEHINNTIKTQEELTKFISLLKYPNIKYHHKLINSFGYERLDKFVRGYLKIYPILDVKTLKIVPNEVNGWYGDDIEVSSDLTDNDFVLIEDLYDGYEEIDVEEFFKRVKEREEKPVCCQTIDIDIML